MSPFNPLEQQFVDDSLRALHVGQEKIYAPHFCASLQDALNVPLL
jgi:hypothetical protein